MNKRIFSSLLASLLLLPQAVYAAPEVYYAEEIAAEYEETVNEPTTQELEAVIKATKPLFDIPEQFSEFNWDYFGGSSYSDPYWTLRWSTPNDASVYGHASLSCDAKGRIKSFNIYTDSDKRSFPEYTKNELIDTAKAFMKKIAPDANLSFDKANDAYGRYASEYTYSFVRVENGIEYPDNNASVSVNFTSGKVTSCSIRYDYDIPVSADENTITKEKAAEILSSEQNMKLSYSYLRETLEDGTTSHKAVLVYAPTVGYISVDAKTGEIYHEKTEIKGPTLGSAPDKNMAFDSAESEAEGGYQLTEEEIAQLEVLNGLITKDEAVKKITDNPSLYLDMALTATSADLSKHYDYYNGNKEENYVWNVRFSDPKGGAKYNYAYASATVDAKSGEIIGFDSSLRSSYYYEQNEIEAPKVNYTAEQCEKVFSDFVKANIPEKFEKTEKTDVFETNVIKYIEEKTDSEIRKIPVYGAYGFNYVRVNDGLQFTPNRIRGTVDGVTGKISSYGYTWTDELVFEPVASAMSEEEAYKIFLSLSDFGKYYERYDEYTFKSPEASTPEEKFRAFVVSLKENTEKYEEIVKAYAPDIDIKKLTVSLAAGDEQGVIELAAEYFGVKVPDSDYFYDSIENLYDKSSVARLVYKSKASGIRISALTGAEVNYSGRPMEETYDGDYTDIEGHWAQRYITVMADLGVLERAEKFLPDEYIGKEDFEKIMSGAGMYLKGEETEGEVTRLSAVKRIIDSLGYGKIASIEGIYRTEFADNPEISEKDVGYLAIAYGLGIIEGDAGTKTFRPTQRITKAEAVKLAVEAVKASY